MTEIGGGELKGVEAEEARTEVGEAGFWRREDGWGWSMGVTVERKRRRGVEEEVDRRVRAGGRMDRGGGTEESELDDEEEARERKEEGAGV